MSPNYSDNAPYDSMGERKRGAAMGRPSIMPPADAATQSPKVTLQRVRLDSGGYDPTGAYFGRGSPLYWAATDDGALDITFRAADRDAAKAYVRDVMPGARFYR